MLPEFKIEKLNNKNFDKDKVIRLFKSFFNKFWNFLKIINYKSLGKNLSRLILWFFVVGSIFIFSYIIYVQFTLPDPSTIAERRVGQSTKIYDSTGQTVLYDIHGEEKRTVIPWQDISESIKKATLASEDSDFYNHKGIDLKGIVRAFLKNLKNFEISQGGSTITQQLVKSALVGVERTYSRKIKEAILSVEIEKRFTKDEIFWMYLNQIPYGSNAYGVEAASQTYFNKKAKDLNYSEAATLTAISRGTTYYSPYGSHVKQLLEVRDGILKKMLDLDFINQEEYEDSLKTQVEFRQNKEDLIAPHFVIMVKEYLVSKYGDESIENGGFKITTTLDPQLQSIAEEVVGKYAAINKQKYKADNASLVAINPKDGSILALVGSADYFDVVNEGNFNVALAKRQPGSSFKPFAYAMAFKKGFPDTTILFDLKTEFNPNCPFSGTSQKDQYGLDCYNPQNYDGIFRGPVTMRQALTQSLNIPAVKTLYLAGIDDTIDLATQLGITTLTERDRYGLSLVLGGAEVRLVDITSAYGVFSNDGIKNPWFYIKKIELPDGSILEENKLRPERVLDQQTARLISNVLSDNQSRAPVFGINNPLTIPGIDIAAKTGTTQENRDAWVLGYTSSLAVGVWSGNNDNKSMTQAGAGISASGPMWNEFMRRALEMYPAESFNKPDPIFTNKIMLNGNYSYQSDPSLPSQVHNILYYINKNDPFGPIPSDPSEDQQFNNWESSVRAMYGF